MIKAVFIDIDETLTNSQREVTEKTKLEIKKKMCRKWCKNNFDFWKIS